MKRKSLDNDEIDLAGFVDDLTVNDRKSFKEEEKKLFNTSAQNLNRNRVPTYGGDFNTFKSSRKSIGEEPNTLIRMLNTFNYDWRIRVRVTKKQEIREWSNPKGTGKLFNVDLMDSEGS